MALKTQYQEAQRAAVREYAADITAEFTEVASGKKANRQQLAAANTPK